MSSRTEIGTGSDNSGCSNGQTPGGGQWLMGVNTCKLQERLDLQGTQGHWEMHKRKTLEQRETVCVCLFTEMPNVSTWAQKRLKVSNTTVNSCHLLELFPNNLRNLFSKCSIFLVPYFLPWQSNPEILLAGSVATSGPRCLGKDGAVGLDSRHVWGKLSSVTQLTQFQPFFFVTRVLFGCGGYCSTVPLF